MKEKEKPENPTIELFLSTPGAEYAPEITEVPAQTPPVQSSFETWPWYPWSPWRYNAIWHSRYNNWQHDWHSQTWPSQVAANPPGRPPPSIPREFRDLPRLGSVILRQEDFGALAYNPSDCRIFRLNPTGAELVKQLKEGKTLPEIQKNLGLDQDAVREFLGALEDLGLWKD